MMTLAPEFRVDPWRMANRVDAQMFGLCTLTANLYCTRSIQDAIVHVRVGDVSASLPAAYASITVGESLWQLQFLVNSHLLPNGAAQFQITLEWDDGVAIPLGEPEFTVDNTGALAALVRRDLIEAATPAIFAPPVDSSMFPYTTGHAKAWFEQTATPDVPLSFDEAPTDRAARDHLMRWGFAVLPQRMPAEIVAAFNEEVDAAIADGRLTYRDGSSDRIHGAHRLPNGRKIWLHPPILSFLRDWFGDEPCACQTLLYIRGSEQNGHQDTIHLTPYPAGLMSGVWIPLEDIKKDSGELFFYPGSHRLPRLRASELGLAKVTTDYSSYARFDAKIAEQIAEGEFRRYTYTPKTGQILVWHENLVHGGSPCPDRSVTRRSIVSHYYPKGGVAYYDSRGEAAALERLPA